MTRKEIANLERKISDALRGMYWECTVCFPADAEAVDDFECEGGKIVRRSQSNIVLAIRKLGLQFDSNVIIGDVQATRPDGATVWMSDDFATKKLWLEIERRFGFRPTFTFFKTVLWDYIDRVAPSNRRASS